MSVKAAAAGIISAVAVKTDRMLLNESGSGDWN